MFGEGKENRERRDHHHFLLPAGFKPSASWLQDVGFAHEPTSLCPCVIYFKLGSGFLFRQKIFLQTNRMK